ncbi:MAG TPA: hypothetical protein VFB95_13650 [Candidatus Cryosericum sp.]|nr:hypothetical protein [Candidatus Cryosericum sp.]
MAKHKGKFTLELQTENLAAWMPINNTFAWDKNASVDHDDRYWSGVLIQLGQYKKWGADQALQGFDKIDFYSNGKVEATIPNSAFTDNSKPTWINIVISKQNSKLMDPMSRKHLDDLRLDPPRTIDKYLKPYAGGITLWSENGYKVTVKSNPDFDGHKKHVFTTSTADNYEVEIYKEGASDPEHIQKIDKIVVSELPVLTHGSHDSPPNDP